MKKLNAILITTILILGSGFTTVAQAHPHHNTADASSQGKTEAQQREDRRIANKLEAEKLEKERIKRKAEYDAERHLQWQKDYNAYQKQLKKEWIELFVN